MKQDLLSNKDISMTLYEEYNKIKNSGELSEKIGVLNKIIEENPKLIEYLFTKVDSCYGEHKVYLVHMKVNGVDMIKIGYTKNSVEGRFAEKRYAGRDDLEIVEIKRENSLQAKGAIDFEKHLKQSFKDFKSETELTLPGKGEFYDIKHIDKMIEIYDKSYLDYINVIGLKSPN